MEPPPPPPPPPEIETAGDILAIYDRRTLIDAIDHAVSTRGFMHVCRTILRARETTLAYARRRSLAPDTVMVEDNVLAQLDTRWSRFSPIYLDRTMGRDLERRMFFIVAAATRRTSDTASAFPRLPVEMWLSIFEQVTILDLAQTAGEPGEDPLHLIAPRWWSYDAVMNNISRMLRQIGF